MGLNKEYTSNEPSRAEVDDMQGPVVVEFGTDWCGHCRAAQPLIASAFEGHSGVQHLKIEDGKGRRLGRSFGVKLWPTLFFLQDGADVAKLVRPGSAEEIADALARIDPH